MFFVFIEVSTMEEYHVLDTFIYVFKKILLLKEQGNSSASYRRKNNLDRIS